MRISTLDLILTVILSIAHVAEEIIYGSSKNLTIGSKKSSVKDFQGVLVKYPGDVPDPRQNDISNPI